MFFKLHHVQDINRVERDVFFAKSGDQQPV